MLRRCVGIAMALVLPLAWAMDAHAGTESVANIGTPAAVMALKPGDAAPDFAFTATPFGWRYLHDLRAEGSVLMVFRPDEAMLVALQRELPRFARCGVVPIAVIDRSIGQSWDILARLGLTYSLFSDTQSYLAEQFGFAGPRGDSPRPGWCLVMASGRILRLSGEVPGAGELAASAERALAPAPPMASSEATR